MTHPFDDAAKKAAEEAFDWIDRQAVVRSRKETIRRGIEAALQAAWDAAVKGGRVRGGSGYDCKHGKDWAGHWIADTRPDQLEGGFPVAIIKMEK